MTPGSDKVHRYIVAYDVVSDARRTRVAKKLQSYGDRLQYSVFLVDAKPAKVLRLKADVVSCLDLQEDSAFVCDLGPVAGGASRSIQFLGCPRAVTEQGSFVL
jgi:CRISPR-associated protein Cas2